MDDSRKKELIAALQAKGVRLPCPRCGQINFELIGESIIPINDNPSVVQLGGPAVPVVMVACSNCGFVTMHAQGSLGVMRKVAP